jgi:hypothetical protein
MERCLIKAHEQIYFTFKLRKITIYLIINSVSRNRRLVNMGNKSLNKCMRKGGGRV